MNILNNVPYLYIVTSGNSLAGYLKPENALALSRAVLKYGRYPIVP